MYAESSYANAANTAEYAENQKYKLSHPLLPGFMKSKA